MIEHIWIPIHDGERLFFFSFSFSFSFSTLFLSLSAAMSPRPSLRLSDPGGLLHYLFVRGFANCGATWGTDLPAWLLPAVCSYTGTLTHSVGAGRLDAYSVTLGLLGLRVYTAAGEEETLSLSFGFGPLFSFSLAPALRPSLCCHPLLLPPPPPSFNRSLLPK
jgi:hypothetical protein